MIMDAVNLTIPTYIDNLDLQNYDCIARDVHVEGNMAIKSKYISLAPGRVGLTKADSIEIKSENTNVHFQNSVIKSLRLYGSTLILLHDAHVQLAISTVPSNIVLSSNHSSEVHMILSNTTKLELSAANSTGNYDIAVKGGIAKFSSEKFSLLLENPVVEVAGEISFDSPYIHSSPYVLLAGALKNLHIDGYCLFKVRFSDNSVAFISDFTYEGSAKKISLVQEAAQEDSIPWILVLVSPLHALVIVFSLLICFVNKNIELSKEISKLKREKR